MTDTFNTEPLPKVALTRTPATLRSQVKSLYLINAQDLTEFNAPIDPTLGDTPNSNSDHPTIRQRKHIMGHVGVTVDGIKVPHRYPSLPTLGRGQLSEEFLIPLLPPGQMARLSRAINLQNRNSTLSTEKTYQSFVRDNLTELLIQHAYHPSRIQMFLNAGVLFDKLDDYL
jgi:hypothetical protein